MTKVKTAKKKTKAIKNKCKVRDCTKKATYAGGYCYYHFMNEPEMSPITRQQTRGGVYKEHPTKGLF